jgi:hypothetical protein
MGKIHPDMVKFIPKGVIMGPNSPQNGPTYRNFKIIQTQDLIARSKNLAKVDLMINEPTAGIIYFPQSSNRPVSSGLTRWAQLKC